MANEILTEKRGAGLIVSFNRPEQGNAFNLDLAGHLFNLLKNTTTDKSIRAVLLRGNGGQFMNGLDMSVYAGDFSKAQERGNQLIQPYHSAIRELLTMEKPVIAAVEGHVAGPGMSFMLAADLVIAARGTKFNTHFATYAMSPDGASSFFLARKVGASKASEFFMLTETFDVDEAKSCHLVNRVVDDSKLHDESMALLDRLSNAPTRALGAAKMLIGKAFEHNINAQMALEHTYAGGCSRTFDFREAIMAHFAKRPPKYSGA